MFFFSILRSLQPSIHVMEVGVDKLNDTSIKTQHVCGVIRSSDGEYCLLVQLLVEDGLTVLWSNGPMGMFYPRGLKKIRNFIIYTYIL